MPTREVVILMLAAMTLAGCGSAQQPVPHRADIARSGDPVLAQALSGEQPQPADEPRAMAQQITVAETVVRDHATSPDLVAAAGRTAQVAYDAFAGRPDWDGVVLAEIPAALQDTVRHNVAARREMRAMSSRTPTTVPAWRIVEPLAVPQLRGYYDEAQQRFGVPWTVLAAVHLVETRMGRIIGLSSANAQGPMQFLPATWARYGLGGDVWNARDAILGAANYLAANGAAEGTDARLDNALFRYNNDTRYVRAVRHYSAQMQADERAYLGYHAWQVYYRTHLGEILLPTGYEVPRSMPVEEWLAVSRGTPK